MNYETKRSFLNPVMATPWTFDSNPSNPMRFSAPTSQEEETSKMPSLRTLERNENMTILMSTFPGLRKYEARAALTLGNHQLEPAVRLLQIARRYRSSPYSSQGLEQPFYKFNTNEICPFKHYHNFDLLQVRHLVEEFCNRNNYNDDDASRDSGRTGVVICKTSDGYKASML